MGCSTCWNDRLTTMPQSRSLSIRAGTFPRTSMLVPCQAQTCGRLSRREGCGRSEVGVHQRRISNNEAVQREASSSVSEALEADGARRLRNESFLSAPQLKRDPLGRSYGTSGSRQSAEPYSPICAADARETRRVLSVRLDDEDEWGDHRGGCLRWQGSSSVATLIDLLTQAFRNEALAGQIRAA